MPLEKALNIKNISNLRLTRSMNQVKTSATPFNPRYIVLTAAKDDEVAWDGNDSSIPGGLFTSTLISVITRSKTPLTYSGLIGVVGPKMAPENQHPQLERRFGNANARLFEPIK
jgi:hypothetical protein